MAVTFSVVDLAAALRLGDSTEETAEVTRLLAYGTEAVVNYAPDAPDVVQNEAVRVLAGYLFDQPTAGRGMAYANAMRSSGAARMLFAYRVHRLGLADAVEAAQQAVGSTANPVVDVGYSGDLLTVTYADGQEEEFTIAGGSGVDQTARDSAATAQTTASDAETTADTTQAGLEGHISQHPGAVHGGPPADGTVTRDKLSPALQADVDAHADQSDLDTHTASEHNTDQTARDAAETTETGLETHIAQHPTTSGGLTAAAITALEEGDPHSNVEIPGVVGGLLRKFSFGRIIALVGSSVGLGPRLAPTPDPNKAGETVVMNPGGSGYTTRNQPFVPQPVDGQIIIGSGPLYTTTRLPTRSDSFPHVSRIPVATVDSSEVVYLDARYHEGGLRQDVTLRIGSDGNISGYIDPRLGAPIGSINAVSPVIRIRVVIASDGTTIERWDVLEFFEEVTANEFYQVFLNNGIYNLGVPFAEGGLWKRRFITEPIGFEIDTDIAFNLRRPTDGSPFHTDGTGTSFNPGLWQKYVVRDGTFAYDHLSGPRISHSDGTGEPLNQPERNGEFYVDSLGRTWVGLVDRHILTTAASATSEAYQHDHYIRDAIQESEVAALGVGGFTWLPEVGSRDLLQTISLNPYYIEHNQSWYDAWDLLAAQFSPQVSPISHNEAIANRDGVWLGGFRDQAAAAAEASHVVSQAEFDAGTPIFYGHSVGNIAGVRKFLTYTQGVVTQRVDGHWVGPFAKISDVETIANDILDDAVKAVNNEAAAMADDRMGVLFLFPGGLRYNSTTYSSSGGGAEWHWVGEVFGGAFVAGVARAAALFAVPGYTYAELREAVTNHTVKQVAVFASQNDAGGADGDGQVFVLPHVPGFTTGETFVVFPAWNLGVNPIKITVTFAAAGIEITTDANVAATPTTYFEIGVWL